jgi:heme-degrading monooxygenase HmoA
MIIREWRGRAAGSNPHGYPHHFHNSVVPELLRTPGFLGAQLSKRDVGNEIEFQVVTRWDSIDAIKGFAGTDIERAVVEPGAVAELISFDPTVMHYEVLADVQKPPGLHAGAPG